MIVRYPLAFALLLGTISTAGAMDSAPLYSMVRLETDVTGAKGGTLFHWDMDGWLGGDGDKFWVRSEGAIRGSEADDAEIQVFWSHTISDYWDFQTGVRQDFAPARRTYAIIGFEGLAPYFLETQAHLFVSNKGDVTARLKQTIDLRITQQLVAEPRAEINVAAQNVPDERVGAGVSDLTLGLQLRYEIVRKFAPYVDFVWSHGFSNTVGYLRLAGEPADELTARVGIRVWF